jgi:hypothetical protein
MLILSPPPLLKPEGHIMVDDASRSLTAPASGARLPLFANTLMRALNGISEGELVLRFANGTKDLAPRICAYSACSQMRNK